MKTRASRRAKTPAASAATALPDDPPFLTALLQLAKKRDWPRDFALNHGHYTKGQPKK